MGKIYGLNSVALPERVSQGAKIWVRLSISNYIANRGRVLNEEDSEGSSRGFSEAQLI